MHQNIHVLLHTMADSLMLVPSLSQTNFHDLFPHPSTPIKFLFTSNNMAYSSFASNLNCISLCYKPHTYKDGELSS